MKQIFIFMVALLLLSGCMRGGNQPTHESAYEGSDSIQLKSKIETAIQHEIRKLYPADSIKFELTDLRVETVDQIFINNSIISQISVYGPLYMQRSNAAIDASQFNKDSMEINRLLAARYLDTVKLLQGLENKIKHTAVTNGEDKFYHVQFNFTPVTNGKAMPTGASTMFFDNNFKAVEASAIKLLHN